MYARILVPIDGSSVAERGLDEAIALAQKLGSTLHVLNVVDARMLIAAVSTYAPSEQLVEDWRIAGESLVPEAVKRARSQGVTAEGRVSCNPSLEVYEAILREARSTAAELIVMGTHGRRGRASRWAVMQSSCCAKAGFQCCWYVRLKSRSQAERRLTGTSHLRIFDADQSGAKGHRAALLDRPF